jgi:hypothetical protein
MNIINQIHNYIDKQSTQKAKDLLELHNTIKIINSDCKLWFHNGKNAENKVVSNPNIGYGSQILKYSNGKTKEFYKIGISANTTGISIYILGINDGNFLIKKFGDKIGKAKITGYCIKFKRLEDINIEILKEVLLFGLNNN